MPASNKTADQVTDILIDELGFVKAEHLVTRLQLETTSNASYTETLRILYKTLCQKVSPVTEPFDVHGDVRHTARACD